LVRPCSTGSFTLQETPSFAWRTSYSRYDLVYIDIEQKTGKERHEFGFDIEDAQNTANLVTILSKR